MQNDKLAQLAEVWSIFREVPGSLPNSTSILQIGFIFQCAFYQANLIILEKTLNQNYQSIYHCLWHLMRIELEPIVFKTERVNHCAVWYFALLSLSFKTIYTRLDGFSTLVISYWLICTTRRWDRGSVWGHTLFLSELIFF